MRQWNYEWNNYKVVKNKKQCEQTTDTEWVNVWMNN